MEALAHFREVGPRQTGQALTQALDLLPHCVEFSRCLAPDLGQHNAEIYRDMLGMTAAEIDDLKKNNII
jgi:crotonobetainyl-CoA:carnitine CoA-transferase CaiB-like acyl-CoA transferase